MLRHRKLDQRILEMAIVGYGVQREKITAKIAHVQSQLDTARGGVQVTTGVDGATPVRRRTMSAAARGRIATAQKKRWAAFHKANGEPAEAQPVKAQPAKSKRKLSAAGRRAVQDATRKRWAAFHKAQRAAAESRRKARKAVAKEATVPEAVAATA